MYTIPGITTTTVKLKCGRPGCLNEVAIGCKECKEHKQHTK